MDVFTSRTIVGFFTAIFLSVSGQVVVVSLVVKLHKYRNSSQLQFLQHMRVDNKGHLAWIRIIILDQKHSVIVNIKVKPKTDLGGFIYPL